MCFVHCRCGRGRRYLVLAAGCRGAGKVQCHQEEAKAEFQVPPLEEVRRSKSKRGCSFQCASMDATILDATYLLPTAELDDGATKSLDDELPRIPWPVDVGTTNNRRKRK